MSLLFYSDTVAGATGSYLYGPVVPLDEWHHLAMTWDGAMKVGYLDGVEVARSPTSIESDTNDLVISGDLNDGTPLYHVEGSIDEVMIYSRALSATEIAMLAK
jgi:hypothetical protein